MFDHVVLEDEQKALLRALVEEARSVPREKHGGFRFMNVLSNDVRAIYFHLGADVRGDQRVHERDLDALAHEQLLSLRRDSGGHAGSFDVTPRGYVYYEFLRDKAGGPIARTERAIVEFMKGDDFVRECPGAQARWARAEALLSTEPTPESLTTIGHLCREASQEFVSYLVDRLRVNDVQPDRSKTVSRFKSVLARVKGRASPSVLELLDALLTYLGTVLDLIQRQEHGATREGELLTWEDARRVVFQTAMVMYEIDRVFRKIPE